LVHHRDLGLNLIDTKTIKGPKHEFYYLWDQNENLKLIAGPNDLLSLIITTVHFTSRIFFYNFYFQNVFFIPKIGLV